MGVVKRSNEGSRSPEMKMFHKNTRITIEYVDLCYKNPIKMLASPPSLAMDKEQILQEAEI